MDPFADVFLYHEHCHWPYGFEYQNYTTMVHGPWTMGLLNFFFDRKCRPQLNKQELLPITTINLYITKISAYISAADIISAYLMQSKRVTDLESVAITLYRTGHLDTANPVE